VKLTVHQRLRFPASILMKASIHPPLYLLTATGDFFLGATLNVQGEPESPDRSEHPVAIARTALLAPPELDPGLNRESASLPDDVPGKITGTPIVPPKATKEPAPRGPILETQWGDIEIFPVDNPWNQDISDLPVHPDSDAWIRSIGINRGLHPDFGTVWNGAPNGIPYVVVPPNQPKLHVKFQYDEESDVGPYPIPPNPPIEGGPRAPHSSDRHIIMIDAQNRRLYELFNAIPDPVHGWRAGSGAIFDLSSNALRPDGWTSADAAGLPVFPGLVRYEEVAAGEIRHALRFTVQRTQRAYIHPARHFASRSDDSKLPPLGLRVRLRADYDISRFPKTAQVILTALKKYGMLLADNGSDWFISGAPNPKWQDGALATIKRIKGRNLECVVTGPLIRR
jgi:hypothetical protein